MEYRTLIEPVEKIYFEVVVPDTMDPTRKNREIRNWLGANCRCTWETQINYGMDDTIGVYFDLGAEKDATTFKMFWHGIER